MMTKARKQQHMRMPTEAPASVEIIRRMMTTTTLVIITNPPNKSPPPSSSFYHPSPPPLPHPPPPTLTHPPPPHHHPPTHSLQGKRVCIGKVWILVISTTFNLPESWVRVVFDKLTSFLHADLCQQCTAIT